MKTIVPVVYPLDFHRPMSFFICVIFVVVFAILVATNAQTNDHENTYERKPEVNPELSKNPKELKVSTSGGGNNDSMMKVNHDHRNKQSSKTTGENSPALNRFLDDVLKARNDFKWIDQVVHNGNREKDLGKGPHHGNKLREKRGYDRDYEYANLPEFSRQVNFHKDRIIKGGADLQDEDVPSYGPNGKDAQSFLLYDKGTSDDQQFKDWPKTKDLCSLSDWLSSNKNPEPESAKSRQQNELESVGFDERASTKTDDIHLSLRNQRDETKKEGEPSLESLKETILELKKSLNDGEKTQHQNLKNVDAENARGKADSKENQGEGTTRAGDKYRTRERKDEAISGWWENSEPESLNLKKREQGREALDEKNAHLKVWRTKRTEVNNDDGNPKLFHRAGFGEPYLEPNNLKEFHDRKRRSKGTPSDEKRHINEAQDKNNLDGGEKKSMKMTKASSCEDADDSQKKEFPSNDLQGISAVERENKLTNNLVDAENSKVSKAPSEESKSTEGSRNYEQLDLTRENLNAMENKLMKNEEKGESPEGNSSRTFESMTNELQAASSAETTGPSTDGRGEVVGEIRTQKTVENQEDVGSAKGGQVIKVFEPQGRLYQNSERTKKVREAESDEERRKMSQQLAQEKRSINDSGNINMLLKSEKKNLIKFSKGDANGDSFRDEQSPFVLNMFDMKKQMLMENEDKSGKSVSAVYNVKIEKTQVDTPVKREEYHRSNDIPFGSELFSFGKTKVKGELQGETADTANDIRRMNTSEKQHKNSIELGKGLERNGAHEGTERWLGVATGNRMGINIDQDAAQKCNELDKKDNYKSEMERFNDYKERGESTRNTNYKADSKNENNKGRNKKKYSEIFIMPDGTGERIINDRYGHRRILQYMEYSNDDVEDADLNYSDEEEGENQRQFNAEKRDASTQRKERTPKNDKKKAKVNLLIKEKIDKKYKPSRDRNRRNPSVIEYYDYDGDAEQQDHEALLGRSEQGRSKSIYDDKRPVQLPDIRLENRQTSQTFMPPADKKNEHEGEILKEEKEKEKLQNKEPIQEFISVDGSEEKNTTSEAVKSNSPATLSATAKLAEEEGASSNQQSGSRLKQAIVENEDDKGTALDPTKCALNIDRNFNPAGRDDFFQDIQSVDGKDKKVFGNMEPLYDELKKIYDWNEADRKSRPRIKGDQRMYYGAKDKLDSTNKMAEALKDQVEPPEIRSSAQTSGKSETGEKTYPIVSPDPLDSFGTSNVSQSNYFALKSTDDMFKGGSEQNNNTEEKLRGPNAIGKVVEWQAQKVSGVRKRAVPEKDAVRWSLTDQRQYIDTDSRSPYENRKYLEAQFPHGRERVQNIHREKQTVISSRDLHESFVEPLDWIDEFDKDMRVRLSRSLKTVETNTMVYAKSNETMHKTDVGNESAETVPPTDSTPSKSLARQPSSDLEKLFASSGRVKREVPFSYNTFYGDINRHHRDSERMDFTKHSENGEAINNNQFLNSYETVDKEHEKHSTLKDNHDEYDYIGGDEDDYGEAARSADAKMEIKERNKMKFYDRKVKKRKGKGKGSKSKKSRRKRRHRRKHSNDSNAKNHVSDKKHKKHTTKHTNHHNVKKSKSSQNDHRHEPSGKVHHSAEAKDVSTMNPENAALRNKISSLLIADNMDDESQMDSALHGELAGKIVQEIFDQVQKNEDLKVSLGPGLYHKHKVRDTLATDQSYRKTIDDDEIKHTEDLLNKIMLLLNRVIFDEVQKKACISLPPDLVEFLNWMLDVAPQKNALEQLPALPLIHEEQPQDFPRDKFLFQTFPNQEAEDEINELYKKIRLIKHLIKEYSELSGKEKQQIRSIQDFLAKQLDLLLEYIEAKEEAEKKGKLSPPTGAAKGKGGDILQYQIGISNASNRSYSTRPDTFSPLISTPKLLKLNNLNILANEELLQDNSIDAFHRGYRKIRSAGTYVTHNKKHRKRRKRRKKHAKGQKISIPTDQSRHKDTAHKAVAQRRKREYLNEIFWDSVDSGYEEPLIYTSMDIPILALNGKSDSAPRRKENIGDTSRTEVQSQKRKEANELKRGNTANTKEATKSDEDALKELANIQSQEKTKNPLDKEEAIRDKNRLEDEILLLNKRQAWKQENEQQLEEVAFGEDMRNAVNEKELFEKLTEIDKRKNDWRKSAEKNDSIGDCATPSRNSSCIFPDEEKLRMIEEKINVYADSR